MKIKKLDDGTIILIENENDPKSEMVFGNFNPDIVYIIERHKFGDERDRNVKTVEFILKLDDDMIILEAKAKPSKEHIIETSQKMFDSINKYLAFALARNEDKSNNSFPFKYKDTRFRFYLVIKRLPPAYEDSTTDTLIREISNCFSRSFINIWNLEMIKNTTVMTYETAKHKSLIYSD